MASHPVMPHLPPIAVRPMRTSDLIMLAYRDETMSQKEFEAVVRDIYGDAPEEEC